MVLEAAQAEFRLEWIFIRVLIGVDGGRDVDDPIGDFAPVSVDCGEAELRIGCVNVRSGCVGGGIGTVVDGCDYFWFDGGYLGGNTFDTYELP